MQENINIVSNFDNLSTNNYLQRLKILQYCVPLSYKKGLAVLIKFLEITYVANSENLFNNRTSNNVSYSDVDLCSEEFSSKSAAENCVKDDQFPGDLGFNQFITILSQWKTYCSENEVSKIDSILQSLQQFEDMKATMETFEMMKELFPEKDLASMLSPTDNPEGTETTGNQNIDLQSILELMNTFNQN